MHNAARDGTVSARLEVVRPLPGGTEAVIDDNGPQSLTKVNPADVNVRRSLVMRLVADTVDAGSVSRRYLALPGDFVRLKYRPRYRNASGAWVDAQQMMRKIGIGRPSGEQNNDTNNQRAHDIRVLTIRTHVFNLPSGSPCATLQEVQDDVGVLRERMGQATISVAWNGVIHALLA
ncbi:MAG: hypothetical protein GY715_09515 [Planctomycetes bacterium]|nr:hypothetical protein [Planctomycetota bacterium]